MKVRLQHKYSLENLSHLVVLDIKHKGEHVEGFNDYPWIEDLDPISRKHVYEMLDDIAGMLTSCQKLLYQNIKAKNEQQQAIVEFYAGGGPVWTEPSPTGG